MGTRGLWDWFSVLAISMCVGVGFVKRTWIRIFDSSQYARLFFPSPQGMFFVLKAYSMIFVLTCEDCAFGAADALCIVACSTGYNHWCATSCVHGNVVVSMNGCPDRLPLSRQACSKDSCHQTYFPMMHGGRWPDGCLFLQSGEIPCSHWCCWHITASGGTQCDWSSSYQLIRTCRRGMFSNRPDVVLNFVCEFSSTCLDLVDLSCVGSREGVDINTHHPPNANLR